MERNITRAGGWGGQEAGEGCAASMDAGKKIPDIDGMLAPNETRFILWSEKAKWEGFRACKLDHI